jgi:acetyl-CoA carboxylase carboxyltransferase component
LITRQADESGVTTATGLALAGGDPARRPDKLAVRDRLAVLFDPVSFVEDTSSPQPDRLVDAGSFFEIKARWGARAGDGSGPVDGRRRPLDSHHRAPPPRRQPGVSAI